MKEIEFTTTKAAHELHGAHYVQKQRIELLLVIQGIKHVQLIGGWGTLA